MTLTELKRKIKTMSTGDTVNQSKKNIISTTCKTCDRIRIRMGIKTESQIRIRIDIQTLPIHITKLKRPNLLTV